MLGAVLSRIVIIYIYDNYYHKREGGGWKMMKDIITVIQLSNSYYLIRLEKWWCYRKRGEGGVQRVMIVIIIDENDDNSGRPHRSKVHIWHIDHIQNHWLMRYTLFLCRDGPMPHFCWYGNISLCRYCWYQIEGILKQEGNIEKSILPGKIRIDKKDMSVNKSPGPESVLSTAWDNMCSICGGLKAPVIGQFDIKA